MITRSIQLHSFRSISNSRRSFHSTLPTLHNSEQHDITIIGGGPVGLTLSAALANSIVSESCKITLVESTSLENIVGKWNPTGKQWSNRVSSITNQNLDFLSRIHLLPHLDLSRTTPIKEMQIWDGISDARIEFHSSEIEGGEKGMATMMENLNLQRAAYRSLMQGKGKGKVEIVEGKVSGIERGEDGFPIVCTGDRKLHSRLLIGADGANSPVKSYSEIESFGWNYDNWGLVATLELVEGTTGTGTAFQRFLPEGPIAFLPLSGNTASLVWSTKPALARIIKDLPYDLLPSLVSAAFSMPYSSFSHILSLLLSPSFSLDQLSSLLIAPTFDPFAPTLPPPILSISPHSVQPFPLKLSHVDTYLGVPKEGLDRRTCLVGDAAHTVHPLAGQGLNSGLGDVESLVRTLEETVERGGDVGSYIALQPYPRERYIKNHALLSTCDHLSSLYSSQFSPLVALRSTGLETINELPFIKNFLMKQAGAGGGRKSAWTGVAGALDGVLGAVEVGKGVMGVLGGMARNGLERVAQNARR